MCPDDRVPTVAAGLPGNDGIDVAEGQVFSGRYQITGVIGEGGFGRVFEAVQLSMERPVAVKTVHTELAKDRKYVHRFYREARSASHLTSPHVVRIYEFGVDDETGTPFLVMELLKGQTLQRLLEVSGSLGVARSAFIARQVALAVEDAAGAGIVHRDIKPENVFLDRHPGQSDFVKVMDFGLAKADRMEGGRHERKLTEVGTILGTPRYMSPEQCSGKELDARSDLYSLGCVLYEMVVGRPPFSSGDSVAVLVSHLKTEAPELPARLPGGEVVPAALRGLVKRLLRKDPAERPPSGETVANLLGVILSEEVRRRSSGAQRQADAPRPSSGEGPGLERVSPTAPTKLVVRREGAGTTPLQPSPERSPSPERTLPADGITIGDMVEAAIKPVVETGTRQEPAASEVPPMRRATFRLLSPRMRTRLLLWSLPFRARFGERGIAAALAALLLVSCLGVLAICVRRSDAPPAAGEGDAGSGLIERVGESVSPVAADAHSVEDVPDAEPSPAEGEGPPHCFGRDPGAAAEGRSGLFGYVVLDHGGRRSLELPGENTGEAVPRPGDEVVALRELRLRRQVPLVFEPGVPQAGLADEVPSGSELRVLYVCARGGLTWVLVSPR